MQTNYDEDLQKNRFFQEILKRYESVIDRAKREGLIVCVPRHGSFAKSAFSENDVTAHVLVPGHGLPCSNFRTLNDTTVVLLSDNTLVIERDGFSVHSMSQLLFEETFYESDASKYRVWCIERPLEITQSDSRDSSLSGARSTLTAVTNLREAVTFLSSEISDDGLWKNAASLIEAFRVEFQERRDSLAHESFERHRDALLALYSRCLSILSEDARLSELVATSGERSARMLELSLETYLLYHLRDTLSSFVSARTALEDAELNRSLRNSSDLDFRVLQVRPELHDRVHTARLKLSRLNRFSTILGKVGCLKRTVRSLSHGLTAISADDLLPALVYLVIGTGLPNWTAQITFLKNFRLSAESACETNETAFLISSFEAALEHARSAASVYPCKICHGYDARPDSDPDSLGQLFHRVQEGDLREVERAVGTRAARSAASPLDGLLCHPLCTCEMCEKNRRSFPSGNDAANRPIVNKTNDGGIAAIHVAAVHDRANILRYLLANGAKVNAADNDGRAALHHVAAKGHTESLLVLLRPGTDVTAVDLQGDTALHLAADRAHEDCVDALLRYMKNATPHFDPDLTNLDGDTPLHRASKWGYRRIVLRLLEYGSNPTVKNKKCQTPLSLAHSAYVAELLTAASREPPTLNAAPIFSPPSPSLSSSSSESPCSFADKLDRTMKKLFTAINEGDTCLACYYLGLENQCGRSDDRRMENMCHPLCNCERCEVQEEFPETRPGRTSVERALHVNARNRAGETALHVASAVGAADIVRILLDAGANVNARTEFEQRTPLHLTCLCDNVNVLKLLLNCATCELDAQDRNGDTPLHLAVKTGNTNLVTSLVRYGARTNVRNHEGATPLLQLQRDVSGSASCSSLDLVHISNVLKRNSFENAAGT